MLESSRARSSGSRRRASTGRLPVARPSALVLPEKICRACKCPFSAASCTTSRVVVERWTTVMSETIRRTRSVTPRTSLPRMPSAIVLFLGLRRGGGPFPVASQLVVQCLEADPKYLCGPRLVLVGPLQGFHDQALFRRIDSRSDVEDQFRRLPVTLRPEVWRQVGGDDHLALGHEDRPLQHVSQLPDVAGPIMPGEEGQGPLVHTADRLSVFGAKLFEERLDEERDVLSSFPQRGKMETEDVEPIIEVLAKQAVVDRLRRVLIRGGDDPNIHAYFGLAAQPAKAALLEDPEELGLGRDLHLRHLVQEDGPAVGQLKTAHPPVRGAGECPPLVTQDLAFKQRLWNGGAVDWDEGGLLARREIVDRSGRQLLPRPALSPNKDRRRTGGCQLHQPIELLHALCIPDQPPEPTQVADLMAEKFDLLQDRRSLEGLFHQEPQPSHIDRLGDVVVGPLAHRQAGRCGKAAAP